METERFEIADELVATLEAVRPALDRRARQADRDATVVPEQRPRTASERRQIGEPAANARHFLDRRRRRPGRP